MKRRLPRPLVRAWRAVKYGVIAMRRARDMEMHGINKDAVVALLESTGARILDIHDDHAHGTSAPGFGYLRDEVNSRGNLDLAIVRVCTTLP